MNEQPKKFDRPRDLDFALCGVCGGPHDCGFGYTPDDRHKIMWTCSDCIPVASHVYGIAPMLKNKHECESRDVAMQYVAEYLEKLGKFDLAQLSQEEAREMFDVYRRKWSEHMRQLAKDYAPPF